MKATQETVRKRVDEILRIRLDGAQFWDVREFVREKQAEPGSVWFLSEGETPLSDSQIRRYIDRTDKELARCTERSREKLINRHLAQRQILYAKAVSQGDLRTALACSRDEAELLDLYNHDARPEDSDDVNPDAITDEEAAAIEAIHRGKTQGTAEGGPDTPLAE